VKTMYRMDSHLVSAVCDLQRYLILYLLMNHRTRQTALAVSFIAASKSRYVCMVTWCHMSAWCHAGRPLHVGSMLLFVPPFHCRFRKGHTGEAGALRSKRKASYIPVCIWTNSELRFPLAPMLYIDSGDPYLVSYLTAHRCLVTG
jgi:hypothetical protein